MWKGLPENRVKVEVQNDKKWFIYLLDHHEGPFSSDDIVGMIRQGRATSAHYVWRDGMPDWEVLSAITDFQGRLEPTMSGVNPRFAQGAGASTLSAVSPPAQPVSPPAAEPEPAPAPATTTLLEATPVMESGPGHFSSEPVVSAIAIDSIPTEALSVETISQEPTHVTATMDIPDPVSPAPVQSTGYIAPVTGVSRDKPKKAPAASGKGARIFKTLLGLGVVLAIGTVIFAATPWGDKLLPSPLTKALTPVTGMLSGVLGKFISPIPSDLKISPEDRPDMEAAVRADLTKEVRVAVALDTEDPAAPAFYVATNLPDGAVVNVYIEGVSETLLNYFDFASLNRLVVSRKMAKTGRLAFADGKPIPRGKYRVFAFAPLTTQTAEVAKVLEALPEVPTTHPKILEQKPRALIEKTLFLGGEEDEVYRTRLAESHQKIREKAAKEIMELKQFLQALQTQLDLSVAKYGQLSKGAKTKLQVNEWRKFRLGWTQFSDTMNRQFKAWSDQGYQDVYFSEIYSSMKDLGGLVVQMHEAQNKYFEGPDRALSIENKIKVNEAVNQVDAGLDKVRKDIEFVGDPSALQSGLPKRPERK